MSQYFPHEQLEVYGVALTFAKLADELLGSWPCHILPARSDGNAIWSARVLGGIACAERAKMP